MLEYLQEQNFDKQFTSLVKKLKNKTVLVYGIGKMFQEIQKNYDLTKLNIIGVMDKKYIAEDEGKQYCNYKIIPYSKMNDIDADVILIAAQNYHTIVQTFKKLYPYKIVLPLVSSGFLKDLKYSISQIPIIKKMYYKKLNTVVLIKENGKKVYSPKIKNLEIVWSGINNYIEIHEPFIIKNKVSLFCNTGNKIVIGANNNHKFTRVLMGSKNNLFIGKNTTTVNLAIHMFSANNQTVKIGDDCMFAFNIMIRTADAHAIYDKNTREIINHPKDVTLGDHVWITANTTILKGTKIASNSMVGTGSIVNKEFNEENCMIAGAPAKVIKRDINWDRQGVDSFIN